MAGIRLKDEFELVGRAGFFIRSSRRVHAQIQSRNWRASVAVSVDDEQRSRSDQRKHDRAIEFGMNPRHNSVIEFANELRIERANARFLSRGVRSGLDRFDFFQTTRIWMLATRKRGSR